MKKRFTIPQVTKESNKSQKQKKEKTRAERFVSPIFGSQVKDTTYYPSVGYNNGGKQYDSFRDPDKRTSQDDYSGYIIKTDSTYKKREERTGYVPQEEKVEQKPVIENIKEEVRKPRVFEAPQEEPEPSEEVENYSPYFKKKESKKPIDVTHGEVLKAKKKVKKKKYLYPPLSVLRRKPSASVDNYDGVNKQRTIIDQTLKEFNVGGRVVNFTKGPTVTLFEVQLDPGVKYQKVPQIQWNLQGNLEALSIRIEAPIPGKATVGIEVPNIDRDIVYFGDIISNQSFLKDDNPLNVVLGMDISGSPVYLDIARMPHGLIAGSTGSGKSVCINSIISSVLYKAHPDDVKLVLIDPKKVEFSKFKGIPHLATPIITDNKLAATSLKWAVDEMENRYELFSTCGASNYREYLEITGETKDTKHIPYVVIIIDELADLMVSGADVEESIMRLTAKARAAGIHLMVCTQRPSVNVINGTIKTNIPTRIAFKVNKSIDSNIILDRTGAEKLLGQGDMLYDEENGKQRRIQGSFISGPEIRDVVSYIKEGYDTEFVFSAEDLQKASVQQGGSTAIDDDLFYTIARYVVESQNASINKIQKTFGCGFNRVQGIVEKLEEFGIVSENLGSRAREVLVDIDQLETILDGI